MKDLTERQKEILDFIAQFTDDNAYAPTVREICDHFNISIRAVQDHIAALQKKGFLAITRHRSRSMRVLNDQRPRGTNPVFVQIPMLVSGDAPDLLDHSNVSGRIYRSTSYIDSSKTYFAFHVSEDSMRGAGIFEGDIAVAEKTDQCSDGQIAAIVSDGKIKVRRAPMENGHLCFRAESEPVSPIYGHQTKVLGVLVEVTRTF